MSQEKTQKTTPRYRVVSLSAASGLEHELYFGSSYLGRLYVDAYTARKIARALNAHPKGG